MIQYIIIINTWIIFIKTLTSKASKKNLKHFGNKNFECKLFYVEMSFWLYMSWLMPAVHASFWSVTSLKLQWVLIAKGTKWNKKNTEEDRLQFNRKKQKLICTIGSIYRAEFLRCMSMYFCCNSHKGLLTWAWQRFIRWLCTCRSLFLSGCKHHHLSYTIDLAPPTLYTVLCDTELLQRIMSFVCSSIMHINLGCFFLHFFKFLVINHYYLCNRW